MAPSNHRAACSPWHLRCQWHMLQFLIWASRRDSVLVPVLQLDRGRTDTRPQVSLAAWPWPVDVDFPPAFPQPSALAPPSGQALPPSQGQSESTHCLQPTYLTIGTLGNLQGKQPMVNSQGVDRHCPGLPLLPTNDGSLVPFPSPVFRLRLPCLSRCHV